MNHWVSILVAAFFSFMAMPNVAAAQKPNSGAWNTFVSPDSSIRFQYPSDYEVYVTRNREGSCDLHVELHKEVVVVESIIRVHCDKNGDLACADTLTLVQETYIHIKLTDATFEDVADEELFVLEDGRWIAQGIHPSEVDTIRGDGWTGIVGYPFVRNPPPGGVDEMKRVLAVREGSNGCRLYLSLYDTLHMDEHIAKRIMDTARIMLTGKE